jgi:multidrug resistance efflux pump
VARADKARAAVGSSQASLGAAEAGRRSAEVSVEQTVIRAPFDGYVQKRLISLGEFVKSQTAALERFVLDNGTIEAVQNSWAERS